MRRINRRGSITPENQERMLSEWDLKEWHRWISQTEHPARLDAALRMLRGHNRGQVWPLIKDMIRDRRRDLKRLRK